LPSPPPRLWAHRIEQEADLAARKPPVRVKFRYVPLQAVSTELKLAVLVGEDTGFFVHGPLDVDALWEAIGQWRQGKRLRGASTITQQLAKNLFLTNQRSWLRKLDELRFAWRLERELPKRRIFELYLNVIELGTGIYGVDAAARHYYGMPAADLDMARAASLAATIPNPTMSNPTTLTDAYFDRRAAIVERMNRLGHLRAVLARLARK
jgi:monofunctional biosynthetic peptidoglycan transglycosylase